MKAKDQFKSLERLTRTIGRLKYKHLSVHEKINLRANNYDNIFSSFQNNCKNYRRINFKQIEKLSILVQYQWADKHERRKFHDQYSKYTLNNK